MQELIFFSNVEFVHIFGENVFWISVYVHSHSVTVFTIFVRVLLYIPLRRQTWQFPGIEPTRKLGGSASFTYICGIIENCSAQ